MDITHKMYRVSAKALVRDNEGRFLLSKRETGLWELPGGGIEQGETAQETIHRELKEECGFDVATVADAPRCMWTVFREKKNIWVMMLVYETTLSKMDFVPSEECVEFRFVSVDEMRALPLHENSKKLPDFLEEK